MFGTGITTAAPGSVQGLHLVVANVESTRIELRERGVEVSDARLRAPGKTSIKAGP